MNEVWILTDERGHAPKVFADRESAYLYLKNGIIEEIAKTEKSDWKYAEAQIADYKNALAELEENYAEGGSFCIDDWWYCSNYNVYQKDREMPAYY